MKCHIKGLNFKKQIIFLILFGAFITGCMNVKKIENKNYRNQWGLYNSGQKINGINGEKGVDINLQETWKRTKGEKKIIVAILDTGGDLTDPSIKNSVYLNENENIDDKDNDGNGYIDDISGWDFYHKNNTVYDDYVSDSHGTYIANIIAGKHQKGCYYGVAPGITILPVKILHGSDGDINDILEAIDYAYDRGARIFNCSFDFEADNQEIYQKIKECSDAIFICAGGKIGTNIDKYPVYPACYQLNNVISVGAIDSRGELYDASGYGNSINIYAPGENIEVEIGKEDRVYVDGTSAATAYVTGAFALFKSLDSHSDNIKIKNLMLRNSYKSENKSIDGKYIKRLDIDKVSEKIERR